MRGTLMATHWSAVGCDSATTPSVLAGVIKFASLDSGTPHTLGPLCELPSFDLAVTAEDVRGRCGVEGNKVQGPSPRNIATKGRSQTNRLLTPESEDTCSMLALE